MAFLNKMKGYLDKGVEASKTAFTRAGSAVQSFGDKSVIRIEIKQLENKLDAELLSLGKQIYTLLCIDSETSVTSNDGRISGILAEISRLKSEIASREEAIKSEEKNKTDNIQSKEEKVEYAKVDVDEQASVSGEIQASSDEKNVTDDTQSGDTEKK